MIFGLRPEWRQLVPPSVVLYWTFSCLAVMSVAQPSRGFSKTRFEIWTLPAILAICHLRPPLASTAGSQSAHRPPSPARYPARSR